MINHKRLGYFFPALLFLLLVWSSCNRNQVQLTEDESALVNQFHLARQDNLHQTNPDSALKLTTKVRLIAIEAKDPSLLIETQFIQGYILIHLGYLDSACHILKNNLALAEIAKDSASLAQSLQILSTCYYDKQEFDSAEMYLKKGLQICENISDSNALPGIQKGLGDLYQKKNQFDSSFIHYQSALGIYEKKNSAVNAAIVLNSMSNIFAEQQLLKKARFYLNKSIRINDSLGNMYGLSNNYNNMGILYKNDGRYDSATACFIKSIKAALLMEDNFSVIISTYNMANVYAKQGEYAKANAAYREVYTYCRNSNFTSGMAKALSGQAEIEYYLNHTEKARRLLLEALEIAKTELSLEDQKDLLAQLVNIVYSPKNDSTNYFITYQQIADSIFNLEYLDKITQAEVQHKVELKEANILLLKTKIRLNHEQRLILILILLLVILLAVLIILIYFKRASDYKRREEISEKEKRAQKLLLEKSELSLKLKEQEIVAQSLIFASQKHIVNNLSASLLPVKDKLRGIKDREIFDQILINFKRDFSRNPLENFDKKFSSIHPQFYTLLHQKHPSLSQGELRICALIKMGLHTKEIAEISNISIKSAETSRYRIRKKMNILRDQSLISELLSL